MQITTKSPRKYFGTGSEFGIFYQKIKFRIKISKIGTMPEIPTISNICLWHSSEKLKSLVFALVAAPWQSTQTLKSPKKPPYLPTDPK